jgi:anti-sigma B factor antagonist
MSEPQAVAIQPHAEAVWAIIHHHTLDDATIDRMQKEVAAAAAQNATLPVILDLSNVRFVPSMGLGALVMLMRSLKQQGHRFLLVGLQPDVRTTLAVTRLDKLLEIHPRFEDALSQVRGGT